MNLEIWPTTTRRRVLVLVATVVLLAAGCLAPYTGAAGGQRVAIVGDSITRLSDPAFHERLDPAYLVSVDGQNNLTIADQLPTSQGYGSQTPPPDVAVIELGTNDANGATRGLTTISDQDIAVSAAVSLGDLQAHLQAFAATRCVVIVDINANTLNSLVNRWATWWDAVVLPAVVTTDPRVRLAGWNAAVRRYYDAGQPDGPITSDLVHPNALGQHLLADVVGAQVDACTGTVTTTTTSAPTTTTPTTTTMATTTTTGTIVEATTSTLEPTTTTSEPVDATTTTADPTTTTSSEPAGPTSG